jgi:signal transduction histidine kinase
MEPKPGFRDNLVMRRHPDPPLSPLFPTRVFVVVLMVIFAVEGSIMLALPKLTAWPQGSVAAGMTDAAVLTVVVAPAVWWLVVLPIRRLFDARGQLLNRLFNAQEMERARIARDLHDEIGQHFTSLLVGLKTIEQSDALEVVRQRVRDIREVGSAGLNEVRRLARGLRPGVLEDLGLAAAVERLCEDFQANHGTIVVVTMQLERSVRLPSAVETCLYRVLQETLTNVARHAQASKVHVTLRPVDDHVFLRVSDDGCGFDAGQVDRAGVLSGSGFSFGLRSVRERALLLGGDFALRTAPARGTTVEVRVPAAPEDVA